MSIQCPSCNKFNRLSPEKVASKPICGSCQHDLLSAPIEADAVSLGNWIHQTEYSLGGFLSTIVQALQDVWARLHSTSQEIHQSSFICETQYRGRTKHCSSVW